MRQLLQQQLQFNQMLMQQMGGGNNGPANVGHLPPFHGRANENVTTWLFQVGEIFRAKQITGKRAVACLAEGLREAALIWYQNYNTQNGPFTSLRDFAAEITQAFQPINHQQLLRRQLHALK